MPKGLLGYYTLSDWFYTLSVEEQEKLRNYNKMGVWIGKSSGKDELTEIDVNFRSQSKDGWLSVMGLNAILSKDFTFAEKILLKALEVGDVNSLDRHFIFINLIKLFNNKNYLKEDKSIFYCLEDIHWIEEHVIFAKEKLDFDAIDLVSFTVLVDIYLWRKESAKAKDICERALKIGYWKEYFEDKSKNCVRQ